MATLEHRHRTLIYSIQSSKRAKIFHSESLKQLYGVNAAMACTAGSELEFGEQVLIVTSKQIAVRVSGKL